MTFQMVKSSITVVFPQNIWSFLLVCDRTWDYQLFVHMYCRWRVATGCGVAEKSVLVSCSQDVSQCLGLCHRASVREKKKKRKEIVNHICICLECSIFCLGLSMCICAKQRGRCVPQTAAIVHWCGSMNVAPWNVLNHVSVFFAINH